MARIHRKVLFKYEYFHQLYEDMELLVSNTKNFFAEDTPEFQAIEILWNGFLAFMKKRNFMRHVTPNLLKAAEEKSAPSTDDGYASRDQPENTSVRKSKRRRTENPKYLNNSGLQTIKRPRLRQGLFLIFRKFPT